jgi:hypothetical protein
MIREFIQVDGRTICITGKVIRIASLEEEWYEDLENPEALIRSLRACARPPDVLTFWQRLPNTQPMFDYHMDREPVAAIPVKSYAFWWEKQIDAKTRNMVRRAEKKGLIVRPCTFDDDLLRDMSAIFNETPIRQGKPFRTYGKDLPTLKREFSKLLSRQEIFGAYVGKELVGFIFLANCGTFAALGQILSKVAHRDKAPNNALVAKAVWRCSEKGIPYLAYERWTDGSLGGFKRSNGFERFDLPRYFVPLTGKGRLFVSLRMYRGVRTFLPEPVVRRLKGIRLKLYQLLCARGSKV